MAADRQLSANLWLHEFPGWRDATEADVRKLEPTVSRVLQPVRTAFGVPLRPTSWKWWSSGDPRTGSHADGGTVDFVLEQGRTADAFEWGAQHLIPSGYIGRWIYEPARAGGDSPQGEHIHMAPQAAMVEAFSDPRIQVLEEREEGEYFLHFEVAPVAWGALLALGAGALFLFNLARRRQSFAL